ncbi:winged helix-turn-helix transcriptional regulator [Mucilaginibacter sp. L3T2-6]|nr:winged helix-turn-helix transcriptional regulator [Mucilaginibacter sp. L3T2-6]MDO3645330.1 winged helix-turn-helix transcriptional regulator [Mucilaginibacter sp. L3T2-6]
MAHPPSSTPCATGTAASGRLSAVFPGSPPGCCRELKDMEMNKLLTRTVIPDTPVVVEYTPTDYCRTFGRIILAMIEWEREHRVKIRQD